ncbi:hypothetical protein, partial [Streptomyces galilaeus]|uniref:hypothetical protein n=1 Tax=Streptomyces galilaeus TaxID=33899 RepID=UPI0038F6E480
EAYQKVLGFVATLRENPSISEPPIVHFKYRFDQTQSIWNATAIVRDKETTFGWISTKCTEDGKQLMFNVCYDTKQTGYIELGV